MAKLSKREAARRAAKAAATRAKNKRSAAARKGHETRRAKAARAEVQRAFRPGVRTVSREAILRGLRARQGGALPEGTIRTRFSEAPRGGAPFAAMVRLGSALGIPTPTDQNTLAQLLELRGRAFARSRHRVQVSGAARNRSIMEAVARSVAKARDAIAGTRFDSGTVAARITLKVTPTAASGKPRETLAPTTVVESLGSMSGAILKDAMSGMADAGYAVGDYEGDEDNDPQTSDIESLEIEVDYYGLDL